MPIRLSDIKEKPKGIKLKDIPESPQGIRLSDIPNTSDTFRLSDVMTGKENSFAKMSKFGKILDILGRPGYAIKSLILQEQERQQQAMSKAGFTSEEITDWLSPKRHKFMIQYWQKRKPEFKKDLEALQRGFTGQERITANELWKNLGVEKVPLLGFATEIATDPLMWFGGAGYKEIAKGITIPFKFAGRMIKKLPVTAKVIEKVQPVTSALKEMFVTKTGLGKLNILIDKYLSKREYLKGRELKFGIKTRNVIQNISKKTGQSIDDIEKQVVSLIEQPQVEIVGVIPETKALANTIKSHLSNILTTEMKAGVPITSLAKGTRGIEYFPRITSREAVEYLRQARKSYPGVGAKVWNKMIANAKARKTRDFTLAEFNAFAKEHGLEILGGKSVEQFFMKQPAYAVAVRGIRSAKAVTSAQFLDDAGRTFGSKINPGYYEQLPDAITKLNPRLKNLWFDPEVAGEITRVTKSYFNPNEAKVFIRGFDIIQNLWKKWTLAPFPKYHLRNMIGNIWNNYLAGVELKNYPKAQALQMYRKYKGTSSNLERLALTELKKFGFAPQLADDIIRQAEQTGVLGRGWYAADIETGIRRAMGKKGLIGRGMAFGSTIENNARLAHFLDRLNKGDDALVAAKSVKKFLFDYQDLTAFEKQVMKRFFPFYTWTRKNIPLQLEYLWKEPQKFMKLAVPLRARNEQDLLRLKYARPDLYERLPVELRRTIDTVTYVPLEGLIPAGDLAKIVRPQEILTELLTPYLRAPIELAMNKSFYFESEIQRYPEETQELLRMDIPVKLKYVLTTVMPQARMLNEINKLVKKQVRKKKLTPAEQAFAQSLSSIYKVNLKDLRDRALRRVEKKMQDLKRGAFWAKRYERTREGERIRKTYEELKELMKQIKGQ